MSQPKYKPGYTAKAKPEVLKLSDYKVNPSRHAFEQDTEWRFSNETDLLLSVYAEAVNEFTRLSLGYATSGFLDEDKKRVALIALYKLEVVEQLVSAIPHRTPGLMENEFVGSFDDDSNKEKVVSILHLF